MNLTDDVIRDLLPLVREGDASADTRALVEAWLATHPALAEEARRAEAWTLPEVVPAAPDGEREALRRTKRLLGWRTWSMALAIFFTALPLSFFGNAEGVRFFILADHPGFAGVSLVLGLGCWGVFLRVSRALRPTGF